MLVAAVAFAHPPAAASTVFVPFSSDSKAVAGFGLALIPVFFAYTGFVSPTYVIGETKDPGRTLPLGLIIGICVVIAAYVAVNVVCVRVLGAGALATTKTPASDVMSVVTGPIGARIIAIVVTTSTLGFISTKLLLVPRLYHRMAADGLFFKQVAWVDPKTRVPVFAIAIEGVIAIVIAMTGTFESIVDYVVLFDYVFIALAAVALVIFRRRDEGTPAEASVFFRTPGHPYTTAVFFIAVVAVIIDTLVSFPVNSEIGASIVAAGVIAYFVWNRLRGPLPRRVR